MVGLLYMHIHVLEDADAFLKGLQMVSPERREKVKNMQNPMAARLSLTAGILLQLSMDRMGIQEKQLQYGKHGKPMLCGEGFHFNLSHSGEYAVCAYGNLPIGVDVQAIKDRIPKYTKKILSTEESRYLEQCSQPNREFFRLWTRKEAAAKWDSRGLQLPFEALSFVAEGRVQDSLLFEDKMLYFHEIALEGYCLCICQEKKEPKLCIEEIGRNF